MTHEINPFKQSVPFVGRRQTVESQTRRRRSGSPLFPYRSFCQNLNKNENNPENGNGLVQLISGNFYRAYISIVHAIATFVTSQKTQFVVAFKSTV